MSLKYPEKVEQLKKAIDVSGKKLLYRNPSDEKIDNQIDVLINAIERSSGELKKEQTRIYSKLDFSLDEKQAEKFITTEFYKFVGFDKFGPLDINFWRNFSSAPFYQDSEDKKGKGGIGMNTIFDTKFESCYSYCYEIPGFISSTLESFKIKKTKDKEKSAQVKNISPYKNLSDLEDNVVVKKIAEEAKTFYLDYTKSLEDRIEVFNKHGEEDSCIHQPYSPSLKQIFEIYNETGYSQRHEIINCLSIVEWWIERLVKNRTFISYKENKYHPELKMKKRNYKPSKEAIERLRLYYTNIIIEEGVANFELDW